MSLPQEMIEKFEYPVMPYTPPAPSIQGVADIFASAEKVRLPEAQDAQGIDRRIEEEARRAFAAGRESGLAEGRQMAREAHAAALKSREDQSMAQVAKMVDQFAQERDRYLHAVEREVVKLALAVAARILRREAQMDPLLLTGAVRVALGQLSSTTEARLRVPAAQLDLWVDAVAHLPNLAIRPQVVAGEGMLVGDCVIETSLGSVDLGIRSQLGEIERGFFDRAAKTATAVLQNDSAAEGVMVHA